MLPTEKGPFERKGPYLSSLFMSVRSYIFAIVIILLFLVLPYGYAFEKNGCGEKSCSSCHKITLREAQQIIDKINPSVKVESIRPSKINGLWELQIRSSDKTGVVYIDFSKKHLISGSIAEIPSLVPRKVNIREIPADGSIVMGNPNAKRRIYVFDDPECPACGRFHQEIKRLLGMRKDISVHIILYPLPIHKNAFEKAKSIICAIKNEGMDRAIQLLEDSFNGKSIPPARCDADGFLKANIKAAERLHISSTPTIILDDGTFLRGVRSAEELISWIDKKR